MGKMKAFIQNRKEKWAEFKKDYSATGGLLDVAGFSAKVSGWMAGIGAALFFGSGGSLDLMAAPTTLAVKGTLSYLGAATAVAGVAAGVIMTGFAGALAGIAYVSERSGNKKIATVQNKAGQTVKGPNWALERCLAVQREIINLSESFNGTAALPEEAQQKIKDLINDTAKARQHLTIVDAGNKGAGMEEYQFIRPVQNIEILNKKPESVSGPVMPTAFAK